MRFYLDVDAAHAFSELGLDVHEQHHTDELAPRRDRECECLCERARRSERECLRERESEKGRERQSELDFDGDEWHQTDKSPPQSERA